MGFWSGYLRWVRYGRARRIWVRRAACRGCRVSHALLPAFVLARRLDAVAAIGAGLAWAVGGRGMRPIAAALGVPHSTARDWRRRFRARAPTLVAGLAALAVELAGSVPALPADPEAAALAALGAVWAWVAGRLGVAAPGVWQLGALVSGGAWLSTTTPPPWAGLGGRRFLPPMP